MNIDSLVALLSSPGDLWETLKPYVQFVVTLAGTVIGVTFAAVRFLKGWGFLARYHYDGGFTGYVGTLDRFLRALWLTLKSDVWRMRTTLRGVRSTDAARLLTELEILQPAPSKPSKLDREGERPRKDTIEESVSPDLAPDAFEAEVNARYSEAVRKWEEDWDNNFKKWNREWANWRASRNRTFAILMKQKTLTREEQHSLSQAELLRKLPVIVPKNLANIDAARERIERYFKVGRQYEDVKQFVSYLKLENGYFAPLFLVSGLMTRFQADWWPILRNYRSQLQNQAASELLELQSFEFNCWLLWGPSVPLCRCGAWRAPSSETLSTAEDPIFYQYGFGDENNSIDVRAIYGRTDTFINTVGAMLVQHQHYMPSSGEQDAVRGHVYAAPKSILGKLRLGWTLDGSQFCPAQEVIKDAKDGRVILDFYRFIDDKNEPSNYYSAYIWVMFIVTDLEGHPIHSVKWKNLLPFFEHGNIADASTMLTLKLALAVKATLTLAQLLRKNANVKISYACALDNSNCGAKVLYPPPQGESIFELLVAAAGKEPVLEAELKKQGQGRLVLDNTLEDNVYASCELPKIIDEFGEAIHEAEEKRHAQLQDGKSPAPA